MSASRAIFAAITLFSFSSLALAQTIADCRALVADAERLACYDALSAAPVSIAPVQVAPAPSELNNPSHQIDENKSALLDSAWELDPAHRGHILRIRPYKPVYILPFFYSSAPNREPGSPAAGHGSDSLNELSATEAKLQISFKNKLLEDVFGDNGDLWFGYTQSSRWQVYHGGTSRPFRETNHEPELMLLWRTDYTVAGWHSRLFNFSLNHQSKGRSLPLSRSWNRAMLSVALERNDWILTLRPWWRISERSSKDDNPDISNYLGRADLQLVRRWGDQQFSMLLRHSLQGGRDNRGAIQLDYAFPIAGELRGHLQWFSGYGESMIDYNHRSNYYGFGVSLIEWY
jgi:phospholipase A1/A2